MLHWLIVLQLCFFFVGLSQIKANKLYRYTIMSIKHNNKAPSLVQNWIELTRNLEQLTKLTLFSHKKNEITDWTMIAFVVKLHFLQRVTYTHTNTRKDFHSFQNRYRVFQEGSERGAIESNFHRIKFNSYQKKSRTTIRILGKPSKHHRNEYL